MMQAIFQKQQKNLEYFFAGLNFEECEQFVDRVVQCKGIVFLTGVGKSGFIGQKIAATLLSTGTKAAFLSPIDALHGDLGMVSSAALLLILSKSGETDELLELLPFVRSKGAGVLSITSNPASRLARSTDLHVTLPCVSELCPFDLAPTTSTEVQLLFGDALSIAVMEKKEFRLEEYAKNHPGGQIGRRMTTQVRDLMLHEERTPTCLPSAMLGEVLAEFTEKRCGCLIVTDEKKHLQGIFTDGDLRRAIQERGEKIFHTKIGDLMTKAPKSIPQSARAREAIELMEESHNHPITVLPVVDQKREVVGVIKLHDLIQANL
ncbi:MAG: Arabinose 5-phosphate isomerase KdsD [Chlamydiae bacterium]|nr:Arabinose 5-phosphate isomerase KdsD [Chlamydiota bacterium]